MTKWVYMFTEGDATMRNTLGGKGANLAEMTKLGLPVPQGFTITTDACTQYYEDGRKINDEIMEQIMEAIVKMEEITGKKFGDKENPLLVSVRSGARASMPGMMDTILNLGLNEEVVETLASASGNARWAWDCYRRFIQMYSDVVMEVGKKYFEELIDRMKEDRGVTQDVELTAEDLHELAEQFKAEYKEKIGEDFPSDPKEQLMGAVKAVFRSWDNPRANVYRRDNDIPYSWGTAVNVQMMAFGNMGDDCGTGVAFTRDPATGENGLFGEFLTNAQGEDVVAGVRTPQKIDQLKEVMPEVYEQFVGICKTLEDHYRDMQDMEFTIEDKKLYMLQNAIICTFTAVPQEYGISLSRRYTFALGLSQERNTALIAPINCSFGSVGKSAPIFSLYSALNWLASSFRSSAVRSTSCVTPLSAFILSISSSKYFLPTSITTSEYIWINLL